MCRRAHAWSPRAGEESPWPTWAKRTTGGARFVPLLRSAAWHMMCQDGGGALQRPDRGGAVARIDPVSLALLAVGLGTVAVLAIATLVAYVRARLYARRWRVPEDLVIDLTFVSEAIQRDREMAAKMGR